MARSKLKLPAYPYGRSTSAYKAAKRWLSLHGKNGFSEFDYPDYAGMPKTISARLFPDEVDWIQQHWLEDSR